MNMSEDITGASLQMGVKVAEVGAHAATKTIDLIANLLQALAERSRQNAQEKKLTSTDLTDIKSGEQKIEDLRKSAMKNGDTISVSQSGFTKSDVNIIAKKAKQHGIPVAFTGDKDSIIVNVRTSDMPVFERICCDMMKEKVAQRPQELGNFKVQKWEIPHITAELNKFDLSANFCKMKNGEYMCLFEKKDEKAVLIARNQFEERCKKADNEIELDHTQENGGDFYTVRNVQSGKEISFSADDIPSHSELSEMVQNNFGYDKQTADLVCDKFGQEELQNNDKTKFFSGDPQNEFSKIDTNITVEGESIYAKEFTCWRMTPCSDKVPKIVYSDQNGNFAVLSPEKMTNKEMSENIETHLNIKDKAVVDALVDKANKVNDYYTKQNEENFSLSYEFQKRDFDMTDTNVTSGMLRTTENGETLTKALPIDKIENNIERTDKNNFSVDINAEHIETDSKGEKFTSHDKQTLVLSFSDKKNALNELADIYRKNGVPDHIAKQMAKDTFAKAENQSAEKIATIEEIKENKTALVILGNKTVEIDLQNQKEAVNTLKEQFGVSDSVAEKTIEKAEEKMNENNEKFVDSESDENNEKSKNSVNSAKSVDSVNDDNDENSAVSAGNEISEKNGHEKHNTDMLKDIKKNDVKTEKIDTNINLNEHRPRSRK